MLEVIEKLDHIEAANTAKIEEIKGEVNVSMEAMRTEVAEKVAALEAKVASIQIPSIIQPKAKTVSQDVNRRVKEQLSDFVKSNSRMEKEISLFESDSQYDAFLK